MDTGKDCLRQALLIFLRLVLKGTPAEEAALVAT
jgi:hypothetical protein